MGRQHVAAAFLLGTLYVYTVVGVCIIPMWGTRSPGSITAFCLVGVYVLWFLSCYLRAVFTKPGHPSPKWKHRPHVFVSNISQRKKKAQKEAQGSPATSLIDEPPSALPSAPISKAEPAAPAQMVTGFMQKDGPSTYSESELEACEAQPLLHNQYERVANAETTEPAEVREPPDCERVEAETEWPYCSICSVYKPVRTHHCKRCNRCTLKMDHHCFWINNCVGFYNHKFFFQALCLGFFGCIATLCFLTARIGLLPFSIQLLQHHNAKEITHLILFCLSGVGALVQSFTLGSMFFFHVRLILHNRTHIEHHCCKGQNQDCNFDQGVKYNVKDLMGSNLLYWICPLQYKPFVNSEGDNYIPIYYVQHNYELSINF
ncbi:Palmitoyltransferase [Balamuthia mandrillaris]